MNIPANYKQVLAHYNGKPKEVKDYFPHFSRLVQNYPWDVSIAYVFSRVEFAKRMAIYCGIVKLHWAESSLARKLIDQDHMSRARFKKLFKTVFDRNIKKDLLALLEEAEKIRDKIAHGRDWKAKQARKALCDILDFAEGFNTFVYKAAGFKPFGNLKGFKGRKVPLPKKTSQWVLKGMGIPEKDENSKRG